jgi:hypothetical protein
MAWITADNATNMDTTVAHIGKIIDPMAVMRLRPDQRRVQ